MARLLETTKAFANCERLQAVVKALREVKILGRTAEQIAEDLKNSKGVLSADRRGSFSWRKRGAYWDSEKEVFPTYESTLRKQRTRGYGRGGRWKWYKEEEFDLKAEQLAWLEKRYRELVVEKGYSREMAREIVEGQIRERGASPTGPLKKILDGIFGTE